MSPSQIWWRAEALGEPAHADDHLSSVLDDHTPIPDKNMANTASRMITRKIALTTALVTWVPSDSALPSTLQAFEAADKANDHSGERRLDHAGHEMLEVHRFVQLVDIGRHIEAEHAEGHHAAAGKPHDVAEKGEQRQRHDEREHARQHQRIHGIDAERAHGVDLLAHLHGADLGGEGRA